MRGKPYLFAVFMFWATAVTAEEAYVWPLEVPRVLTSSFAEYRDRGFHMGIDLRTGGIGRDVRAMSGGEVVRIRTSPNGYGKVVYLELKDGHMVVYAHLSEFAPPLATYVRAAQHLRKSYEVDLYPKRGQFPVNAGDLLAKSGQTGIGAPHLHFEIRDPQGRPINPRLLDIAWPDSAPPEIRNVLVVPATPDTTINGDILPVVLKANKKADGNFDCEGFVFNGAVAFGVRAIDRDSAPSTRLGVASVHTRTQSRDVFSLNKERISYTRNRDGAVVYHPYFLEQGRFLVQWRWPGNDTEIYGQSAATGMLYSDEPPGELNIHVADFLDNRVTVSIPVREDPDHGAKTPRVQKATEGRVEFGTHGTWLTSTVRFDAEERYTPILNLGLPRTKRSPFRRIDDRTFRANFLPPPGTERFDVTIEHPRVARKRTPYYVAWRNDPARTLVIEELTVTIHPNSPYGLLLLRAEPVPVAATRELRPRGKAYALWHPATPLDQPIDLAFPVDSAWEKINRISIYRQNGKSDWERLPTEYRDGKLRARTVKFGTFAPMEDVVRPSVSRLQPKKSPDSRRPVIQATVDDGGSGIDSYTITANGKWLLAEYDPERRLLSWARDEELEPGETELEFQLVDVAGNVARRTIEVTIPGS